MGNLGLSFAGALSNLLNNRRVYRNGWHLGGMYLQLQVPDANSANTLPYIYIVIPGSINTDSTKNEPAQRVPWVASQTDLLSNDWEIVPDGTAGVTANSGQATPNQANG
jgi:hypothetical protein